MFNGFEDILIFEMPHNEADISFSRDKVNKTNLHTGVWALFNVYEHDDIDTDDRRVFSDAKKALDESIDEDELYKIMELELPHFDEGYENMLRWAELVVVKNALLLGDKNA